MCCVFNLMRGGQSRELYSAYVSSATYVQYIIVLKIYCVPDRLALKPLRTCFQKCLSSKIHEYIKSN